MLTLEEYLLFVSEGGIHFRHQNFYLFSNNLDNQQALHHHNQISKLFGNIQLLILMGDHLVNLLKSACANRVYRNNTVMKIIL